MQTNTYSAAAPVGPVAHGSIIDGLAPSQAQNQNSFAPYRMCGGGVCLHCPPLHAVRTPKWQVFHAASRHFIKLAGIKVFFVSRMSCIVERNHMLTSCVYKDIIKVN